MALSKPIYVYTDIETDTLRADKLLQIAAITEKGEKFTLHINPKEPLPLHCTNITGLYFHKNNLYKNGRLMPSVSIKKALNLFKNFIIQLNAPVHLVFHNGFAFDIKILLKHFHRQNIQFPSNVEVIHDTLPAFRKKLVNGISDHRLGTLATFLDIDFRNAHDALADSEALRDICEKFTCKNDPNLEDFLNLYQKPISHFVKQLEDKQKK